MCAVCSPLQCRARQFGIGNSFEHQVSDLTKYESDESTWFLNIDGRRLKLSTEQLYDQHKFRKACLNEINMMPNLMRPMIGTRDTNTIRSCRSNTDAS